MTVEGDDVEGRQPPTPPPPPPTVATVDVVAFLKLLILGVSVLIVLGFVVGIIRNALDLTAALSVLATIFSGLVAGYLAASGRRGGPPA